eukprot:214958_1
MGSICSSEKNNHETNDMPQDIAESNTNNEVKTTLIQKTKSNDIDGTKKEQTVNEQRGNNCEIKKLSKMDRPMSFEYDRYVSAIQLGSTKYIHLPIEICTLLADFAVGLFVFDKEFFSTWNSNEKAITLNHWNVLVTGGSWDQVTNVMSSRPINNMQSFGIIGNPIYCNQIGIGFAIYNVNNRNEIVQKGIRFQKDCIGFYKDAKTYHWNNEKTDGWEYVFNKHLQYWDNRDNESSKVFWITYIKDINGVLMWYPGKYKPILFKLPKIFENVKIYPKVQVWNNCGCQLVHGEPWPIGFKAKKVQFEVEFIKIEKYFIHDKCDQNKKYQVSTYQF